MFVTPRPAKPPVPVRRQLTGRHDRGVTLIELLITIAILGIIMVPIASALITFLDRSDETTNRLSESHDAQIAAVYFAQDVDSLGRRDWTAAPFSLAQSVELNVGPTQGLFPCGTAGTPTALVRLLWDDPTAAVQPSVVRVSYVVETAKGEQQLHRIKCVGNATPVTDVVLAHNVASIDPVTCSTSCIAATVPQTITMTLHLRVAGTSDPLFNVTLTGQRRQT